MATKKTGHGSYTESFIFAGTWHYRATVYDGTPEVTVARAPCDTFGRVTGEFETPATPGELATWLEVVARELLRRKAEHYGWS